MKAFEAKAAADAAKKAAEKADDEEDETWPELGTFSVRRRCCHGWVTEHMMDNS